MTSTGGSLNTTVFSFFLDPGCCIGCCFVVPQPINKDGQTNIHDLKNSQHKFHRIYYTNTKDIVLNV